MLLYSCDLLSYLPMWVTDCVFVGPGHVENGVYCVSKIYKNLIKAKLNLARIKRLIFMAQIAQDL